MEVLDDHAEDILYSNQGKISVKWLNIRSPSCKWILKAHLKNVPFGTQNTFFTFTSVSQPRGYSPFGVVNIYGHFFPQFDVFIFIRTQQTRKQIHFYLAWWQIMSFLVMIYTWNTVNRIFYFFLTWCFSNGSLQISRKPWTYWIVFFFKNNLYLPWTEQRTGIDPILQMVKFQG